MKRAFLFVLLCNATILFYSCGSNSETKTHTHTDGSTHADHDTTKPSQQEFNVTDTAKITDTTTHTHEDGETHSH